MIFEYPATYYVVQDNKFMAIELQRYKTVSLSVTIYLGYDDGLIANSCNLVDNQYERNIYVGFHCILSDISFKVKLVSHYFNRKIYNKSTNFNGISSELLDNWFDSNYKKLAKTLLNNNICIGFCSDNILLLFEFYSKPINLYLLLRQNDFYYLDFKSKRMFKNRNNEEICLGIAKKETVVLKHILEDENTGNCRFGIYPQVLRDYISKYLYNIKHVIVGLITELRLTENEILNTIDRKECFLDFSNVDLDSVLKEYAKYVLLNQSVTLYIYLDMSGIKVKELFLKVG